LYLSKYDNLDDSKSKSVIIHSCGFESIPSDICVYESVQALRRANGNGIKIGFSRTSHDLKAFVSRGTITSALTLLDNLPRNKIWESGGPFCLSPIKGIAPPSARLTYSLAPGSKIVGSYFLLGLANRAIVNRSWGLRQSEDVDPYGPEFVYEEFLATHKSRLIGFIASTITICIVYALLYMPPFRTLMAWIFDRDGTNSDYQRLKDGSLVATNITWSTPTSEDPTGKCSRTVFKTKGCDVGYLGTSVMISECALALILNQRHQLPLNCFRRSRVLTPTTALGSILTGRLVKSGFYDIQTDVTTTFYDLKEE